MEDLDPYIHIEIKIFPIIIHITNWWYCHK